MKHYSDLYVHNSLLIECHPVLEDLCGSVNDITVATGPGSVQHSRPHETVGAERVCMRARD